LRLVIQAPVVGFAMTNPPGRILMRAISLTVDLFLSRRQGRARLEGLKSDLNRSGQAEKKFTI